MPCSCDRCSNHLGQARQEGRRSGTAGRKAKPNIINIIHARRPPGRLVARSVRPIHYFYTSGVIEGDRKRASLPPSLMNRPQNVGFGCQNQALKPIIISHQCRHAFYSSNHILTYTKDVAQHPPFLEACRRRTLAFLCPRSRYVHSCSKCD